MDERQGTESSWIPKTPMKLTRAEQQSICKEKQTNSPSIPHWLIAGRNSETSQPDTGNCSHLGSSICFNKEIQAQNAGDSCNRKASVTGNLSDFNGDSSFYFDLWNRGMAHLINDDAAQTAVHADKSSFTSASIYHVKGASSRTESSSYSSSTFKGLFQESGCQSASETYQTNDAELNGGNLYHRAPSTPNLTNTAEKAKGSDEQNDRVDVAAKENEDHALNKNPIELSELQKEGQAELDVDISCSNVSNTLVENHEPDMGSSQNIDVKTPQQRPRKKKHRPKVVIEGKPKRKPRNTTPASSEKVNTPKRKYVRKINASTAEAETTPTESRIQGDPGSEAKTTLKRKYTRRKEVNEPTVTPLEEEGVSGTSSPKNDQTAQRSCRRSLKFDFDSQIDGEKSSCQHMSASKISLTENQMTSALKPQGRVDINVERTETCHLQSMGKEFEEYLLSKGVKTVNYSPPPTEFDQLNNKSMAGSTNEYSRGRCQILFSDATHDKVGSILESRTQKERGATKPLYASNYSSILTQETYGRGKKREQPSSSATLFDSYSIYSAVPQGNYFQDFTEVSQSKEHRQEISFQHFPETFKKKKSNQARTSTNSTMMPAVTSKDHHVQNYATSIVNNCREACGFGMMQVNNSGPSRMSKVHSAQLKQTPFEWFHPLRNAEKITMEESNGLPHSYLLSCFTPTKMLKSMPSVDDIVEQLNRLNVSAESNTLASVEKNALFAYPYEYSGKNALVVYQRDQTMIPFDASSNRKKRGPRPKVNLDEETARVWTLLLENIDSEGIDGTDEDKRKYWEKERKIFRGRVNSFIAKMRLVQGDRRFRPWKGSVVDSVVGVFLTQNVSDHLSSSAFMSMAARFPLKPSSDRASSSEGISEIHDDLLHLDEDASGEGDFQVMKNDENFQELVRNYQKLVRNFSEVTESTGTLKSPSSDSSECGPSASNGETVMLDGDSRASGDILCSQTSVVSPQNSTDSIVQTDNKKELCSHMFLEEESTSVCFQNTSSFVELLQMQEQRVHNPGNRSGSPLVETRTNSEMTDFAESLNIKLSGSFKESECVATDQSGLSEESGAGPSSQNSTGTCFERHMCIENHESAVYSRLAGGDQQTEFISTVQKHASYFSEREPVKLDASNCKNSLETTSGVSTVNVKPKPKSGKILKEAEPEVDWDSYRKQAEAKGKKERTSNTMDSVDWETVRCTEVGDIADTIKERGMNNRLAARIKDFLNRLIRDHGSLDLEWLRDIPPDKAKEYLLSVKGLGLKSVECVRLLTLHHLAFPVDTNVGRIAVRLGWVPLQPLPESLQLHLLELYPVLESIQKHLWPRLCKLDQRKLYELHYHMITFGKVFCTKSKPNCNSCPMRGECRHFASAYASARLALPAPQDKSIVTAPALQQRTTHGSHAEKVDLLQLPRPESTENLGAASLLSISQPTFQVSETPKPIIEEPTTPESEVIIEEPQMSETETDTETQTVTETQGTQCPVDIEDYIDNDDEIPTIDLNLEALNRNLQSIMQNVGLQDSEYYSKALMVLTPEAASIPMPKLKNINRLRTEHRVYLLPDSHQLLKGLEKREENDPCPYLLAIWAPGETINSIQPPERKCSSEGSGQLCFDDTCYSCNSIREATSHTVRGTILIPCRTAMRGSFPLNGTYFQVNEVFADHETSLNPIDVPRDWLWNLRRRTVYFGTSIPTIFKGLEPYEIQYCFWKGFVCVRGFDRATRGPRPLIARLHFPVSRMPKYNKGGAAGSGLAKDASDETPAGKVAAA